MLKKLPDLIDPVHAAKNNMQFTASLELGSLARLKNEILNPETLVEIEISFNDNAILNSPSFVLSYSTCFKLQCQTSLEDFELDLDEEVSGVFLETISLADEVDDSCGVFELPQDKISFIDLIEDELLLAIPMVPRKEGVEAEKLSFNDFEESDLEDESEDKANPFEDLKKLLQ